MNKDRREVDELNEFLDAYAADQPITPSTPEAQLAADLVDLASAMHFDLQLGFSALTEQINQTTPSVSTPAERRNGQRSRAYRARIWLLPLAATILVVFFVGALPFLNQTVFAPAILNQQHLPIQVGGYLHSLDKTAMDLMHHAGMEWVDFKVDYNPDSEEEALKSAHQLIDGAHQQNFRVWITITGAPGASYDEAGAASYAGALALFAGRIAALGANAIQVWETPNLPLTWQAGQLDPASYVSLLRQSYQAIKAANPETLVISAAPAPTSTEEVVSSDQAWNDAAYYQGMARAGAAAYVDCIGVSYTEGALDPMLTEGDSRDNDPTRYFVPALQRAAAPFRETGIPLCITEYGYLAGQEVSSENPFAWSSGTSIEEQAAWLAKGIQIAAELSSVRIQMITLMRVDRTDDAIESGYALIRPDGSCPACDALAQLSLPLDATGETG
ncbi:MAG: hypothetical protein ABI835_17800 [Chloroflexota bacterium]